MNKLLLVAALAVAAYFAYAPGTPVVPAASDAEVRTLAGEHGDAAFAHAFANRLGGRQLAGQGTVARLLPDDNDGSRHQRFIVRLGSGQTLLVSHNIDLAPRIEGLQVDDAVAFYGEYEWNRKGGVMHWTHHDPQGRHPAGWVRHGGRTYR